MSPPIRDGSGNSIGSIRLGDGSEISEVRTGAGDVLFSATPDSVQMFDSPLYNWSPDAIKASDGNSPQSFPERLTGLSDASVSNGNPTFRTDYENTGEPAVVYDSGDGTKDTHSASVDANAPASGDSISVFVAYLIDNTGDNTIFQYGGGSLVADVGNNIYQFERGGSNIEGGDPTANTLTTAGIVSDEQNTTSHLYAENSDFGNTNSTTDPSGGPYTFSSTASRPFNGGLFDITVCDNAEPFANYQEYHDFWTA